MIKTRARGCVSTQLRYEASRPDSRIDKGALINGGQGPIIGNLYSLVSFAPSLFGITGTIISQLSGLRWKNQVHALPVSSEEEEEGTLSYSRRTAIAPRISYSWKVHYSSSLTRPSSVSGVVIRPTEFKLYRYGLLLPNPQHILNSFNIYRGKRAS
ncbi:hypothetical protein PNOK_0362300 [Pyrrhoderma noxium]|uniref:Uncharacterized protein n=1 Tax=Pyrrhoderma noxium TaxID=2282107 RepID=A0A286UN19_9AGAM|nr:hypothetical protein PNOK_0362300 [Pyrrhoderma noxium]